MVCDATGNTVRQGYFKGPLNGGGFKRGGFPDLDLSLLLCPFCPFWDFPDFCGIFPVCSGMVRGFSRLVLFLFLGLLRAPYKEQSPKGSATRSGPFPKKVGNTRVWKPPGLASLKYCCSDRGGGYFGQVAKTPLSERLKGPVASWHPKGPIPSQIP